MLRSFHWNLNLRYFNNKGANHRDYLAIVSGLRDAFRRPSVSIVNEF